MGQSHDFPPGWPGFKSSQWQKSVIVDVLVLTKCDYFTALSVSFILKNSSLCNTKALWLIAKIAFGTAIPRWFYLFLVLCLIVIVLYCWFGGLVDGFCYRRPFPLPHYANNASYHLTVSPTSPQNHASFYTCFWETQCWNTMFAVKTRKVCRQWEDSGGRPGEWEWKERTEDVWRKGGGANDRCVCKFFVLHWLRGKRLGRALNHDFTTNPVCKLLFIFCKVCQTQALIFSPWVPSRGLLLHMLPT